MYKPKLDYYLNNANENSVYFPIDEELMKKVRHPMWIAKLAAWDQGIEDFISDDDWKNLEKDGIVTKYRLTEDQIITMLKKKTPQIFSQYKKKCEWCLCTTCTLHAHHYPIRRKDGGESTVKICPSCHYEFHYLDTVSFYEISPDYKKYFDDAKKQKRELIEYKKLLDTKDTCTLKNHEISFKMYIRDMLDENNDNLLTTNQTTR